MVREEERGGKGGGVKMKKIKNKKNTAALQKENITRLTTTQIAQITLLKLFNKLINSTG